MKKIQPITNQELITLMFSSPEEEPQAREYITGEWIGLEEEFVDDFFVEFD